VEQRRPELILPVDIFLSVGGSAVLSGRWRAFALRHHIHADDCLVFRFRLGALEALVRVFDANGICRN
jgi:hypothetical protein